MQQVGNQISPGVTLEAWLNYFNCISDSEGASCLVESHILSSERLLCVSSSLILWMELQYFEHECLLHYPFFSIQLLRCHTVTLPA